MKGPWIGSLKRFTARRGIPFKVSTYNATILMGARSDLERLQNLLDAKSSQFIAQFPQSRGTEWIMIPRAPHSGRLWESAVKRMKHHLHESWANRF